jgi:putative membrane protein
MMNGMDGMMGGGFGMIFWLILWVAIIALIVWLLMRIFSNRRDGERPETRGDSAEEILRQRFARGEIDAEEYERSLEVLHRESGAQSERTDER